MFAPIVWTVLAVTHAVALGRVLRRIRLVRDTSLTAAARWLAASEFAWLTTLAFSAMFPGVSPVHDQIWYWSAVLAICPQMAVLGARRPTSRVWSLFIVLPMIAVLGWPAAATLFHGSPLSPVRIQAPAFLGMAVALVMGTGNHLGTRFGWAVVLRAAAVVFALVPFSAAVSLDPFGVVLFRLAAGGLAVASIHLLLRARLPNTTADAADLRYDRLWEEFRDVFGIVWSIRLQESLNAYAGQRHLPWRLGPEGITWGGDAGRTPDPDTVASLDQALRWHLRRFVDPEWINRRLSLSCPSPDGMGLPLTPSER